MQKLFARIGLASVLKWLAEREKNEYVNLKGKESDMKIEHVYKDFVALTWYNLVLQRITLDWWSAPIKTLYYDLISWK